MRQIIHALSLITVVSSLVACGVSESTTLINATGVITPVGTAQVAGVTLRLYGAKDLVTGTAPTLLAESQVTTGGTWSASSIDVTQVADALIAVTDEGTDGGFVRTLSGLIDYSSGQSKTDLSSGRLFVVPRSLATTLASTMGKPTLLEQGFVMGVVTDGVTPVAGARVKSGSSLSLEVWYPSADLRALSRAETSANGLFVIPADPALLFLDLVAEKTGHTFAKTLAPLKSGTCSFAVILPATGVETHKRLVDVTGLVTPIGASTAAGAGVEALAPYDYATAASPPALETSTASDAGTFSWTEVDVTQVSQGLLARVSDGAGVFFPTVSGVAAWASEADSDKQISSPAHVFAVSTHLASTLAAALNQPRLMTDGFVMGMVTDGRAPVAGATIVRADRQPLTVIYPNAGFTSLMGTATSANGLFVLLPDPALAFTAVTAVKDASTFAPSVLLPRPGVCFFVALHP